METIEKKALLHPSNNLETDRLIIRKYEQCDGMSLFDLLERNDNRSLLKDHIDEATTIKSAEDAER